MARYTGPVCRLCRREGQKLFLKSTKCYTDKCPVAVNITPPGQHGKARKKQSEYGLQLREKQKAKRYYGLLEKQFRNTFELATKKKGVAGENLLRILECRFDNIIYRLGFGGSRAEARQLVLHGHFTINGRKVNIPSYSLKEGDRITLKEKSRNLEKIKMLLEENKLIPKWLDFDRNTLEAKVITLPAREDIDFDVSEHLIVELYSK